MVLNTFAQYFPLALFFSLLSKNTLKERQWKAPFGLLFINKSGVWLGRYIKRAKEYRAFSHWLGQQFAGGEPDRDEDGVATL